MLQRPINTLLICNWSIVIRLLRWSMQLSPRRWGNTVPAVYADALVDLPIVTTYIHADNSSETNCNFSYYLRRTRYSFERAKGERRMERERKREISCSLWEYFTVINDRATTIPFFFIVHPVKRLDIKIGSKLNTNGKPFSKFARRKNKFFPRSCFVARERERERERRKKRVFRAIIVNVPRIMRERVNKWQYILRIYSQRKHYLRSLLDQSNVEDFRARDERGQLADS